MSEPNAPRYPEILWACKYFVERGEWTVADCRRAYGANLSEADYAEIEAVARKRAEAELENPVEIVTGPRISYPEPALEKEKERVGWVKFVRIDRSPRPGEELFTPERDDMEARFILAIDAMERHDYSDAIERFKNFLKAENGGAVEQTTRHKGRYSGQHLEIRAPELATLAASYLAQCTLLLAKKQRFFRESESVRTAAAFHYLHRDRAYRDHFKQWMWDQGAELWFYKAHRPNPPQDDDDD